MGLLGDLSVKIGANTAELKKGLNEAKTSVNKFSKNTKNSGKAIGNSFKGISNSAKGLASNVTSQMGLAGQAINGLAGSFTSVISGLKGATSGLKILKVALASTGIGLLVVALGSLVTYFTRTQEGADFVSKAMAGVGAVFDVIIDTVAEFGKTIFEAIQNPQEALKSFGAAIKQFVLDRFEQLIGGVKGIGTAFQLLFEGKFKEAAKTAGTALKDIAMSTTPIGLAMSVVSDNLDIVKKKYGEASSEAKKAMQLEEEAIQLEKDKIKQKLRNSELEIELSELIRKSKEKEKFNEEERAAFVEKAIKVQNTLSSEKIALAEEELRIKTESDKLANNMRADDEATIDLKIEVNKLQKEANDKVRELVNRQNEASNAQQAALKLQREKNRLIQEENDLIQAKANIPVLDRAASITPTLSGIPSMDEALNNMSGKVQAVKVPVQADFDTAESLPESFEGLQQQAQAAANIMQQTLNNAFVGIGEGIASALTGGGGIKDILNGLLGMVLDFGAQFGKLLVSIGLARVSLEKIGISGVGAVIAGTALIALTSVAKNLLSEGINGGGQKFATGGIVAGTATGDKNPIFANGGEMMLTRGQQNKLFQMANGGGSAGTQNIHITGRLVGSGNDLVALIDETTRKNSNNF